MAVNHSEATKLRAEGISVRLKDGKDYPLYFGFEALYILEEEFAAGLHAAVDAITPPSPENFPAGSTERAEAEKKQGFAPGRLKQIGVVLEAALIHNRPMNQSIEAARAAFRRQLEFHSILQYLDAIVEAFNRDKPDVRPEDNTEEPDPNAAGSPDGSPGSSSTTSPPSGMAALMPSSGG